MTQKISEISIFFPFWNEEANIETVITRAITVAEKVAKKWEILIIDDGSSDKTLEIATRLVKKNSHLRVISYPDNRGYGAALKEGFAHAKYNLVVFTDGDGQFDFSQINRFLKHIDHADIVIGYRKKRIDHPFRHLLMSLLKMWDFVFFGFYYKDIDCGFKLFRKEALEEISPLKSEGAMITTEILAKAKMHKLRLIQVEVTHYPRRYGAETGGNIRVIMRAIIETFSLWRELH